MRMRISALPIVAILIGGISAFGQDLGQLQQRVVKLWESRKQSNRIDVLALVEPETQRAYLQNDDTPIIDFKLSGFEFTDDAGRINVTVKVRGLIPRIGELDRIVRETWVWKNGAWFMHATPPRNLFQSDEQKTQAAPLEFRIAETLIDAGRHAQGELVEGEIALRAPRERIAVIRPTQAIPGLMIGSPI